MREEALSSVNRKLIDAEERVRGRIGKELHDDIEQRLALLAITAAQLSGEHSNADGAVLNSINQIREQTAKISGDVPVNSDGLRTFQDLFHLLRGCQIEMTLKSPR
jgi:signal transduction histidine kinase